MRWLCALVALIGASASAQTSRSFDLDHLQLAVTGGDFLATEGAGRVRAWGWRAGATFRYSDVPLVLDRGNGDREALVQSRSIVEVSGAITFGRRVGLALALPVLLDSTGTDVRPGAALGDLRVIPRIELVRDGRFGLAALLGVRLPTGDTDRFLGEGMVLFEPRLAAQGYLGRNDIVRLGGNLGFRFREARQYRDLTIGHEVFASLALAIVPRPFIDVVAELHVATALSSSFGNAAVSPVEALLGVGGGVAGFHAGVAAGLGIVDGFGTPRVRALVTLEYRRPAPKPVLLASLGTLPTPPRPVPKAEPLPELPDIDDQVELPVMFADEPDVTISGGRIELSHPIFFDTDRKRIHSRFHDELDQLARALERRPELTLIWIEGHADATGPERWNLQLSRLRSAEVARYLEKRGIDGARLRAVGFGEARPMIATPRGEANDKNRRVHFYTESTP
jgi:OmpA-OmpF porin, OOP family